jgi:16S rRNA (cytosine1402-N4)-methyltransferase
MSSWHLERSKRGFSFKRNELLDMRYNPNLTSLTSYEIVNRWKEEELIRVLREYGEEKFSRRIAKKIVLRRRESPIETTRQLAEVVKNALPRNYRRKNSSVTRVFQALRIAVNQELENLQEALPQSLEVLERGGRLVVISFHSLEDRIVKKFFNDNQKKGLLKILTKKPIRPSSEETEKNPRSRSAKLRAAEKIN